MIPLAHLQRFPFLPRCLEEGRGLAAFSFTCSAFTFPLSVWYMFSMKGGEGKGIMVKCTDLDE